MNIPAGKSPPHDSDSAPLGILVADDYEVMREGVRTVLEKQSSWKVVGEASNGREAVEKAGQLKPDVVIMDITMPEMNGLEATRMILKAVPHTEVLIFTFHESEEMIREVLNAGARGYVLKSDGARDLVNAVKALSQHKSFFTSKASNMVLEGYIDANKKTLESGPSHHHLTQREREIIQLLAEGKGNKEVADKLGISVKTVESHRANIMHKLNFHSLCELVHYAIRNEIVKA